MQGTEIRLLADGLLMVATAGYIQTDTLQSDPAWQQGMLSNGPQRRVLATPQRPSDRVGIRPPVNIGLLAESTQQSGYSHAILRIALTQGGGLGAVQARSLWQQGIDPKRPMPPVIVSYDTTLFNLSLLSNRSGSLKEVLSYLANAAGKPTITPEAINRALQSQDMVATWPADTKEGWWRCRLKGSALLGYGPVDPLERPIEAEEIKDFYQEWYTPDTMTLLVVGNVDARLIVGQIDKMFGGLKDRRETPALVSTLSPLRAEAVSIMTDAVRQDRLSTIQDTSWQPTREPVALLRYWRANLTREAPFWYVQQALSASNSKDIGLGSDYRVLYLRTQCVIGVESSDDRLNNSLNLVAHELVKAHDKGLPEEEFNALMAQRKLELQKLFATYARADIDILAGQRMCSLQNQVVDITPEQYQKLRQDSLNGLTVEMLNQDLRQQLSNDMALILLQPRGKPEFNMRVLQTAQNQITVLSTAATIISVTMDDVHSEVTDIPPVQ